ncbi:MAG: Tad domain-containing protein [Acetobacter sp.]|nr:Tad domain-containing protein [Acetobacter sp.]
MALIFALSLPVLVLFVAIGINLARIYVAKQQLQNTTNAAAEVLAAEGTPGVRPWHLTDAQVFMLENFCQEGPYNYTNCKGLLGTELWVNRLTVGNFDQYGRLPVSISNTVPLLFGGLLSMPSVTITAHAFANFNTETSKQKK